MRRVFTAQSPAEAHLVAGLLEEEGIRCVVEGEMLTGAEMASEPSASPSVSVLDEDESRALEVIARTRSASPEPEEPPPEAEYEPRAPQPPRSAASSFGILGMLGIGLVVFAAGFVAMLGLPLFGPLLIVLVVAALAILARRDT